MSATPEWLAVIARIRAQGPGNCYQAATELLENADRLGLVDAQIVGGRSSSDSGD